MLDTVAAMNPLTFAGLFVFIVLLPWTAVSFTVRAILRGNLVPGRQYEYQRALAQEMTEQNRLLLDSGRVTQDALSVAYRPQERSDP